MPPTKRELTTDIITVERGEAEYCIIGETPLLCNRMAAKAQRELLLPAGRKTTTERATILKHTPVEEFRDSILRLPEGYPTLVGMPAPAFKASLRTAALDMPGATKSQIGRLTFVVGYSIPIYGLPEMFMSVVRMADIGRTPDVRTRAILPRWACRITIGFAQPLIKANMVTNLLASAGMTCGIGDGRQEKGALNFGAFRLTSEDDPEFLEIIETGGRAAQIEAMLEARPHDADTAELLSWYDGELERRKQKGVA